MPVAPTPYGHGGMCPHFYKWPGTRGTVSRRTANKKLIKLYCLSRKRSPKRLIVFVEPKKWRGTTKIFFEMIRFTSLFAFTLSPFPRKPKRTQRRQKIVLNRTCAPTFKFVPTPLADAMAVFCPFQLRSVTDELHVRSHAEKELAGKTLNEGARSEARNIKNDVQQCCASCVVTGGESGSRSVPFDPTTVCPLV